MPIAECIVSGEADTCTMRMPKPVALLFLAVTAFLRPTPVSADWNADLAAIDAQIRAVSGAAWQHGNAVNVLPGVTDVLLEQKRQILVGAGFTWFAPASAAGGYDYGNFYSFTGEAGLTDTRLSIVEATGTTLLYRRGYPNEPSRHLGAWWSASYLSPDATRDELAVLDAWGNPLTGIYVVSVPAGMRMIAGLTSPMQSGDEFRAGGAGQYWLNSRDNDWLVYALYAPDYLGSYVLAVTGAQKLGRDAFDSLTSQLRDFATRDDGGAVGAGNGLESWFRVSVGDTDYRANSGDGIVARGESYLLGCGKTLVGSAATARVHAGVAIGRSALRQTDESSGVEGRIDGNFGGLYAIYRRPSSERFAWYASAEVLYGMLWFDNSVPGWLGRGLRQPYCGHFVSGSLEAGVPLSLGAGWSVTPHAQLAGSRLGQADFRDRLGAAVSLERGHVLWTRMGAEIAKVLLRSERRSLSLWAGGAVVREFAGGSEVVVAGESASGRRIGTQYQIDTGLRFGWAGRYSLQGAIGRVADGERGYRGSASLDIAW
jgi:outer membrane autotransporter protein